MASVKEFFGIVGLDSGINFILGVGDGVEIDKHRQKTLNVKYWIQLPSQ